MINPLLLGARVRPVSLQPIAEALDRHGLVYRSSPYPLMSLEVTAVRHAGDGTSQVVFDAAFAGCHHPLTLAGASFLIALETGLLAPDRTEPTR